VRVNARVWFILSVLASGITLLYRSQILLPWEDYVNEHYLEVAQGRLKAQMGDLYPRWYGTRELLLHRRNPYGPEVSHEIQMAFYGYPIEQKYGEPGLNVIDEQRFVYPVYVVFVLAPTVYVDFPSLQNWAPLGLGVLTAMNLLIWLDLLRWRPPWMMTAAMLLLVLSSPQVMQGLRLRQLGLAVAFLFALSAWCTCRNHLALAGVLLALSTIKPQMAVFPLLWLFIWASSEWKNRWSLLVGFGITLAVLIALGEFVLPGWPHYFWDGLIAYRKYFPTTSLLCLALGNVAGGVVSTIAIAGILAFSWRNRRFDAASVEFSQTLAASFLGAALVLPLITPYNQVLLLLPVAIILRDWALLPKSFGRVFAFALGWPYVCSFVMLLHPPRIDSAKRAPLLPSVLVLLVPYLVLLLFLTRRDSNGERHVDVAQSPAVRI
jgi:hypothetical protein